MKFLSSGLLYRYAAYLVLKNNPKNQIIFLQNKFQKLNLSYLNKKNLHSPKISYHAAVIAKNPKIRDILKKFQKRFAKRHNKIVIEGRDIQSKILPNADIKFFFKCNLNVAALRRYKELKKMEKK